MVFFFFKFSSYFFLQTSLDSFGVWSCNIIRATTYVVPSSPITLNDIANQIGNSLPFVGGQLVYMVLHDISLVLSCVVIWKILKVFPKFS